MPSLPDSLAPLRDLAYNLYWTWNEQISNLFQRLDPELWEAVDHNPVRVLTETDQAVLSAFSNDPGYLSQIEHAQAALAAHLAKAPHPVVQELNGSSIAYFSLEFGLTTCLTIYSGGLGILAGDHLKSASELGLPLIAVGLHYNRGYFHQHLNSDGWQQEEFVDIDYARLPIRQVKNDDGMPMTIRVEFPGRVIAAQVWLVQVGRISLYLLDTNVLENNPEDRLITDRLYGGDNETRIQQEIVLGIGGIRLLEALGKSNVVCHMNEGHSAFMSLERVRNLMQRGALSFDEAREIAAAGNLFTTHTPVPAGIDLFPVQLMDRYFGEYWPKLGLDRDRFLGLGRSNPFDSNEPFSMAVLGIRLSSTVNGVAKLHGEVSRAMWSNLWPDVPVSEVPIGAITNGIHHRGWVSSELAHLYERHLGARWREKPADPQSWIGIQKMPDEELWRAHERNRERLVAFTRKRLVEKVKNVSTSPQAVDAAATVLDPEALTIGFARRFAMYKRATLVFRDPERLAKLLTDKHKPVQILIAGKAHPKDEPAKGLIRQISHLLRRPDLARRVVFLEDYDMTVASYLVQGCDIWLNTPLRPQEASGTSGMKSVVNGGLHCSVLDGWWWEGYAPDRGWAIGSDHQYSSMEERDAAESEMLYDLLEHEIVPRFYDRGLDDVPHRWVSMMKTSISELAPFFNTDRMVQDYAIRGYAPASKRVANLRANGAERAKSLASWRKSIHDRWHEVRIDSVESPTGSELLLGEPLQVLTDVYLGSLEPKEVLVEAVVGPMDGRFQVPEGNRYPLDSPHHLGGGHYRFSGSIPMDRAGTLGYAVRVLPYQPDLADSFESRLIKWG